MKVLRLDGVTGEAGEDAAEIHLTLHPLATVVSGASGRSRQALIDSIAGIPRGLAPVGGLIEADDVRFELTAESLRQLGLGGDGPAGSGPDAIVRAADLPGYDVATDEASARRQAAMAAREEVARALGEARAASEEAENARAAAQAKVDELRAGGGEAAAYVDAATEARDEAAAALDAAVGECRRLDDELERLSSELDAARSAQAEAASAMTALQERRQAAVAAATQAAGELEEVQTGTEPDAEEVLARAEQRLAELEAQPLPEETPLQHAVAADVDVLAPGETQPGETQPGDGGLEDRNLAEVTRDGPGEGAEPDATAAAPVKLTPLVQRISEREFRRDDLTRRLVAVAEQDPAAVRNALDRVARSAAAEPVPVPVPAAVHLADEWRDVHVQLAELTSSETDEHREARTRLEEARRAAREAEQEMRVPNLQPDQVAALEAAHAEVLDAQEKSDARFGGARARKRLEDARSAERTVLDQLGFTTYADFMMSTSSRGLGAANQAILEASRSRLAEAEAAWREAGGDPTGSAQHAELLDRRAALVTPITELLGHEPTGVEADDDLRALRQVPVVDEGSLRDLRSALTEAGVEVADEDLGQDELVMVAEVWLEEHDELADRRAAFEAELRLIDDELIELWQAQERGEAAVPGEPEQGAAAGEAAESTEGPDPAAHGEDGASRDEEGAEAPALPEPPVQAPETVVESQESSPVEAQEAVHQDASVPGPDVASVPSAERTRHLARIEEARSTLTAARQRTAWQREVADRLTQLSSALAERATDEQEAAAMLAQAEQARVEASSSVDRLATTITSVQAARAEAMAGAEAAANAVAALDSGGPEESALSKLLAHHENLVAEAEQQAAAAELEVERLSAELAVAEDGLAEADQALEAARATHQESAAGREELVDEIEWYLLARLAAQRSVANAGSVPLLLDDPFGDLEAGDSVSLVAQLERMSTAVQLIVVSDDPVLAEWAGSLGQDRAAAVSLRDAGS